MSARQFFPDAKFNGQGYVLLAFSIMTNGTGQPTFTYATDGSATRGVNGVTSVSNAATGRLTVTLADGYRYCVAKIVDMDDLATGSDDGAYASSGPITGEGLGNHNALSFDVFTRANNGTKTAFGSGGTGVARRVNVVLVLKNTGAGA